MSGNDNKDYKAWQPSQSLLDQVKKEIEDKFDQGTKTLYNKSSIVVPAERPDKTFIDECAKIGTFLLDNDAVLHQLERLNAILEAKIQNGADPKNVHLLRETIEEELGKLGFHPNLAKAITFIKAKHFRIAITHGLLIKDPDLGDGDHGEFTHALQWLAIAWQQKDSTFIDRPASEIFKELGEEKNVYSRGFRSLSAASESELSMWDIIVDRTETDDFRRPEYLHPFLISSNIKSLSTLTNLLMMRVEKREREIYASKYAQTDLTQVSIFNRKDNRIPYVYSTQLPNILTPQNASIDVDSFDKRSANTK